jgi:uncharacterized delta-60 repeat protein
LRQHRSAPTAFLIAIVATLLLAATANAASSDLDPTFGSGGIVKTGLGFGGDSANGVVVQPDGKVVAVGRSQTDDFSDDQFIFSRYLDNGALDPTFGLGGQAFVEYSSDEFQPLDIALQPDGKILATGYRESGGDYDMAVVRINSNGTLDGGFRGGGKFAINASDSNDDDGKAIALAPDGTFYVVGEGQVDTNHDFMIYKFKADGQDDTSFSGNGNLFKDFAIGNDGAFAAEVQSDGKLVVAGYASGVSDREMAVARFLTNGDPDLTFAGTGSESFAIGSMDDEVKDLAIAPDGKIVLTGAADTGDGQAFAAARLTPGGILDTTFNGDGKASFKVGTGDGPRGMVLRRDGKILISGAIVRTDGHAGLVQFNADGAVDLSFGVGGYVTNVVGAGSSYSDIAQAPDGKIAAAGYSEGDTLVARYLGEYVAPVPAPIVALKPKFSSKLKSKMKAKKLTSISGTAVGTGLAKIQISIGLADKKLLKSKNRCLFVKNSKGETKKYKAKKKKCAPAKWLTAKGTTKWSYKLKRKLKTGKYTIYVRALDASGATQASFSKSRGNLKTVTVTK